jgi:hypothetical protein
VVQQKDAFDPGGWQTWPLGQHWPPTQVIPLAQEPQFTVWPQLFVAVPQVCPVAHVGGPVGVQQVPLLVQTCPLVQQVAEDPEPHPQVVPVVRPAVHALIQVPPQQVPPAQQSAVVVQVAPRALQAAWQVPFTQMPEQQSWSVLQAAPLAAQVAWQVPFTQKLEQQSLSLLQVAPLLLQQVPMPVQVCPLVQQCWYPPPMRGPHCWPGAQQPSPVQI